ncbi:MAG: amidohydrolase [Clostridia bacterium]|nr:amidohydrolase [Clostridia bacterium]
MKRRQDMYKVFDVHTHTYPEAIAEKATTNLGRFYEFVCAGKGTYLDLESQAEENNVQGYLLFSVATNAHQVEKVNDSIASLVDLSRSHGFHTMGFAGMHQDYPDFEKEILRCKKLGLKGVKIHPDIQGVDINDRKLLPLYDLLSCLGMGLYLHMGDNRPQYRFSEAEKLLDVLELFPRLTVFAAHLGGYNDWEHSVPLLKGKKNVYYDTSSAIQFLPPEKSREIIGQLGAENIMFGTDYPVANTREMLDFFMKIKLTDSEREDILWNNAMRILRPDDDL